MSKCIVKILRDETPGGLAEKINKELEKNTRSWDTVTGIKYPVSYTHLTLPTTNEV